MSCAESNMSPHTLPTPQPSTEILPGKRGSLNDGSFTLPPAAMAGHASDSASFTTPSPVNSDSSYRPLSPPSNVTPKTGTSRRKGSNPAQQNHGVANQAAYTLPPPPTRTRKIIQMKPQSRDTQEQAIAPAGNPAAPVATSTASQPTASKTAPAAAGTKRKQGGGGATAASRKIARKTAHSLIERRRRSKMNEEFGVLKDMIPACAGQEMHKLAILQASIEYMRYLEQCLADLKSAHSQCRASPHETNRPKLPPFSHVERRSETMPTGANHAADSDEEMSEATSPQFPRPQSAAASSVRSHQPSISPAILPSAQTSPEIISKPSKYGYVYHSGRSSALPSPAFEGQVQTSGQAYSNFAPLTSPALGPQGENAKPMEKDDHEATAALLMLNTDRRSWSGPSENRRSGRSMSVKDLIHG
ncbi:uncharacterized protein PV09_02511 [Verruconis gallopava]|uniref:BHLH domain-containing protein n=1 Tax=Verruconis gallopava TaxID=253628 RepID=A0A0D1XVL1_9PEZI|nr:uncharacterized protein PV09_02511 [Verruconis gallopava]KIW06831.1 hypothetical protein PV09_02511 [Verruconis gallopava]